MSKMIDKSGHSGKGRTRCEVYSRVVGYLSPVSQWNRGKREEYGDRVGFVVDEALEAE